MVVDICFVGVPPRQLHAAGVVLLVVLVGVVVVVVIPIGSVGSVGSVGSGCAETAGARRRPTAERMRMVNVIATTPSRSPPGRGARFRRTIRRASAALQSRRRDPLARQGRYSFDPRL